MVIKLLRGELFVFQMGRQKRYRKGTGFDKNLKRRVMDKCILPKKPQETLMFFI
jgi:hypothetical protein